MTTTVDDTDVQTAADLRIVEISKEPLELFKILKFEGMTGSGGQAKIAIAAGLVTVNGAIEKQKRKQIRAGDTIGFNGEQLSIKLSDAGADQAEGASE